MKLLIVDDQPGVTEGLCHGVNWAQLGFSQLQAVNSVREARAAMLRALGDELRASERARRAGTVELALVEEGGVAMTESYFEVPAPAGAAPGALVEVTL